MWGRSVCGNAAHFRMPYLDIPIQLLHYGSDVSDVLLQEKPGQAVASPLFCIFSASCDVVFDPEGVLHKGGRGFVAEDPCLPVAPLGLRMSRVPWSGTGCVGASFELRLQRAPHLLGLSVGKKIIFKARFKTSQERQVYPYKLNEDLKQFLPQRVFFVKQAVALINGPQSQVRW